MININDEYNVIINDIDNNGNGITRINNFVIFVPYALLNEKINIKIININKKFAIGKIINIEEISEDRCKTICNKYNECGGCNFLHTNINNEKNIKIKYIEKLFNFKLDKCYFINEYNYRNKATFHVNNNKIGYYSENTHNIIEFDNCLLLDKRINDIYNYLKDVKLFNISSIVIRVTSNETMIIFDNDYDYKDLIKRFNIDSIYINNKLVYGKEYIIETIDNIKYTIYPEAFFQINLDAMKYLYSIIKDYCVSGNKLLDLYCGTGTIGIYLKNNFKNITGIEINKSSILNANLNKKINGINNINFILKDSKMAKNDVYDTIIVDPPRSGLSKEVISFLNNSESKIIYVSCNPNTLKRDIELLKNYKINRMSIVNMFPKTKHIEIVSELIKN